ncbi:MAG: hypothetical protein WCH43_12570 [Verrucomicrobiota bacterium]
MSEVHTLMTALETRFEDELSAIPGWHPELEQLEQAHRARQPEETAKDKKIEESMILGI